MRIENLDISFGQVLIADILLTDGEVVKIKRKIEIIERDFSEYLI